MTDYPQIMGYDQFIGDRRLDLQAGRLVVADLGIQKACGYGSVETTAFLGWPLLSRLCVRKACRRQGVASAILSHAIQQTRYIRLYTSTEASNNEMRVLIKKAGGTAIGHVDQLNFSEERELLFRLK